MARNLSQLTSGTRKFVAFEVGGIVYAADIGRVREIIRPMPTMALPHMPPSVAGVADHRGDVVPIIDLRTRFSVASEGGSGKERWVIVTRGERLTALVVDAVVEVFTGSAPEQRALPEIGAGDAARGISSIYSHRGRLVFVVDVDLLVRPGEQLDMDLARAQLESWRPDALR